jgi:hypothetical protein
VHCLGALYCEAPGDSAQVDRTCLRVDGFDILWIVLLTLIALPGGCDDWIKCLHLPLSAAACAHIGAVAEESQDAPDHSVSCLAIP